ncbi:MAG TPA: helix-turn-helix transcriptional regulator [Nostoc sp.]|uniref:helix-turn-helix domain-containing protein n=1 Tax=Nostoc sp. TaxID=1180 RepID=UPI002D3CEA30|nr:helix-turn-helix transcriptional regulator [Nostoc sp.]HYX18568.1 helix-turn-helix transcriptional regulator [Nostoc sp.]
MTIKWRLNRLMAERRISGKDLAKELNVHPNTIYRLRRTDEMPSIDGNMLEKLCNVLGCELTDLIERGPNGNTAASH